LLVVHNALILLRRCGRDITFVPVISFAMLREFPPNRLIHGNAKLIQERLARERSEPKGLARAVFE
jgi:hypothetical protein